MNNYKIKEEGLMPESVVQSFAHSLILKSPIETPKVNLAKTKKYIPENSRQVFDSYAIYCFQRLCNKLKNLRETNTISQAEVELCGNELCIAFEEYVNYGFDRGMTTKDLERELNLGIAMLDQIESQREPKKSVAGMLFDNFFG